MASGIMDMETKRIILRKNHDHLPDIALLQSLQRRAECLRAAESSNVKLNEAFKNAIRGQEGASLLSYPSIER